MRDPLFERRHPRVERGRLPILGRAAGHQAWNPREAGQLRPATLAPFGGVHSRPRVLRCARAERSGALATCALPPLGPLRARGFPANPRLGPRGWGSQGAS